MPDATPGPAASALAEAKRIADGLHFACRIPDKVPDFTSCGGPAAEAYWAYFTPVRIVGLVAALEAALKLADDLDAEAARLLATAARLRTGAATGTQNRAWAHRDCAKALREAITAALAGKEAE